MISFFCCLKAAGADYPILLNEYLLTDTSFFSVAEVQLNKQLQNCSAEEKILLELQLGQIALSRLQQARARTYFYQALNAASQRNDRELLFLSYFKVGAFYQTYKAPPAIVVKYLYTAKKLHVAGLHEEAYTRLLRLLGYLELEATRDIRLAEKTYDELLQIISRNPESTQYAGIYNNLGILQIEKKQYAMAEKYLVRSLNLRLQKGDSMAISQSYENLGTLNRETGQLDRALDYYEKALGIQKRRNAERAWQETDINIGITWQKKNNYDKALDILEKALVRARKDSFTEFQIRVLPALAQCYAATNHYDKAYSALDQLKELEGALKTENTQDNILRYNIESSLGKKLFEDSLRYTNHLLKMQFENEKKLSIQTERSKRYILSFIFIASLVLVAGLVFYLVTKQKSRLQVKNSEIRALQAQMNPHFIFNSLNSVMEYIRQSEKDKALQYLTKFSRLIRLVLEFSSQKSISLEQEIEMLKYYIDLENLRFGRLFRATVTCSDDVDPDSIEIPSMLIQPFVENAILHGLRNQLKLAEESGQNYLPELQISFSLQGDFLRCVVRDNGAGRQKASEMKQANTFGQKSLGVRITGDRLDLIGDKIHKVNYRDLLNDKQQACGTEVEILIPLEIKY